MSSLPPSILIVAVVGTGLGLALVLRVLARLGRAVLRRPPPRGGPGRLTGPVGLLAGLALLGFGLAALALVAALRTWQVFTRARPVAEIRCVETGPKKLRLTYLPIDAAGKRGLPEEYELRGDEWLVGGDVLRFRPELVWLGLETVFRVDRVEGRYVDAKEARAQAPTVFDRAGGPSHAWLAMYRDGARGPLGWMIAGAHGQGVWQLPDAKATFVLRVTPNGFVLDKN